jgi:hypothetical protein
LFQEDDEESIENTENVENIGLKNKKRKKQEDRVEEKMRPAAKKKKVMPEKPAGARTGLRSKN